MSLQIHGRWIPNPWGAAKNDFSWDCSNSILGRVALALHTADPSIPSAIQGPLVQSLNVQPGENPEHMVVLPYTHTQKISRNVLFVPSALLVLTLWNNVLHNLIPQNTLWGKIKKWKQESPNWITLEKSRELNLEDEELYWHKLAWSIINFGNFHSF